MSFWRKEKHEQIPEWARDLFRHFHSVLHQLNDKMEIIMSSFDELKTSQDAIVAAVAKVRADVEALHAKLDNIPPAGMTPEQQAALDSAVQQAGAIRDALAGIDDLTPDA